MSTKAHDRIIDKLGVHGLRELDALAHACDSMDDGKLGCVPRDRIKDYQPGGTLHDLAATGCLKASPDGFVACHQRRMPYVTILPVGRTVLRRAAARGIDLMEPTHRHRARGSLYRVTAVRVEVQTSRPIVEGDTLTVYVGEDGKMWARLDSEFNDGRFVDLDEEREW